MRITVWNDYICPWAYASRPQTEWLRRRVAGHDVDLEIHGFELHPDLPAGEQERVERFRVNVRDYPTEVPMSGAYMNRKSVDFRGEANLYNHSAYYLE